MGHALSEVAANDASPTLPLPLLFKFTEKYSCNVVKQEWGKGVTLSDAANNVEKLADGTLVYEDKSALFLINPPDDVENMAIHFSSLEALHDGGLQDLIKSLLHIKASHLQYLTPLFCFFSQHA